jgi:type IV conjugative transfer system protein TraE
MFTKKAQEKNLDAYRAIFFYKIVTLISIIIIGIQSLIMFAVIASDRTIVIPLDRNREYEFYGAQGSRDYEVDLVYYALDLLLNFSPESVNVRFSRLARFILPQSFAEFRKFLDTQQKANKSDAITSSWAPEEFYTDKSNFFVRGKLKTYLNDKLITTDTRIYQVSLVILQGRYYVKNIIEVDAIPSHLLNRK